MEIHASLMATLAIAAGLACGLAAAQALESEPTLALKDFQGLPPATGAGYRIDPSVPVSGYYGQFTVHTDLGDVPADGEGLLKQRVAEVGPTAELEKLSQSSVFVDALSKSAANTASALGRAVTDPVNTVKAVPAGVGRFFRSIGQKVESATTSVESGDANEAAKDALGINKAKRQIAQKVGVDPYTTNPILAKRLGELAGAAFAGGVSLDVALAVTTAGIGTAISATKTVSNMAWQMPPADVRAQNDRELAAFDISKATRDSLLGNRWYSPTMALAFVAELKGLGVSKGTSAFAALAAGAQSEVEARFFIAQLRLAQEYAKGGEKIVAIEAPGRIGLFRTANGGLFVPAPLDYLTWSEGVKTFAERKDPGKGAHVIWLSGKASARAAEGLKSHGWSLREHVAMN